MPDRLQIIYDAASEDYDMGTFDEFKSKMLIPEKRRVVFDAVSEKYELGDFETFEQKITPTSRIDDFLEERRAKQEVSPVVREDKNILRQQVDDLVRANPEQYKSIRSMQKAKEPFDIMQSVVAQASSIKAKPPEERLGKPKKESVKPMPISPYGMLPVGEREFDVSGIPEAAGKGLLSGLTQTAGTVGTAMQYTGGKIGIDFLEKAGQQTHEFWEREGEKYVAPEELQGSIIDNPKLLSKGAWYVYNIAQMMPSFAAAFVPAIGAAKYINILGKTMKWTAPTMMRLARLAPSIVGGAAGGVIEGTSTYQEILKRGGTKDEAEAGMELMTLAAGALNAISFSFMTKKMPKGLEKSLLSYLERGGTEAFTEWAEEPSEGMIKMSLGHATWEDVIEQSKQGVNVMFPAFIMGVGGTAISSRMEAIRTGKQPIITEEDIKLRDDVVKAYNEFVEVSGEPETKKITSFEDIDADIYKEMLKGVPPAQKPPIEAVKKPEPTPTLPEPEKVQPAKPVKAVEEVKPVPEKPAVKQPTPEQVIEAQAAQKKAKRSAASKLSWYKRTKDKTLLRPDQVTEAMYAVGKLGRHGGDTEFFNSVFIQGEMSKKGKYIKGLKLTPLIQKIDKPYDADVLESYNHWARDNDRPIAQDFNELIEIARQELGEVTSGKGRTIEQIEQEDLERSQLGGFTKAEAEVMMADEEYTKWIDEEYNKEVAKYENEQRNKAEIDKEADGAVEEDVQGEILRTEGKELDQKALNESEQWFADLLEQDKLRKAKLEPTVEKPKKVGDAQKISGIDAIVADTQQIDGINYELYNANKLKDKRGIVRIFDADSGEVVTMTVFPTFAQAEAKYKESIGALKPTPTEITKKVPADATTAPFDMPDSKTGDIIKQGEPIFRLDDGKIVSEKTYKDLTKLGKQEELLEKEPEKPAIQKIYHFTKSENINKILSEGFDTTLLPIHGTRGLEAGAMTGKKGEDILYFTTDTERWKSAVVYVGEGKGDISRKAYDYQNQEWIDEPNAYKKIDLSPIEAEIKAQAKILKIDSYESGTKAVGRIDKDEFVEQILKYAKENNYDIVHLSDPGGTAWHRPDGSTTKYGDDSWYRVLSGSGGKNDFFVLNKEAIKVTTKLAKTEKPSVKEGFIPAEEADRQTTLLPELEEKTDLFKKQKGKLSPQTAQILLSLPPEMKAYPYGKQNIELRQKILEELTGQKVPKSNAGAGVVRAALAKASNATGEGMQDVERGVIAWIKDISEEITKPVEKVTKKPPAVEESDALEYPKTEKEADQRYEAQALSAKTWDIKLPIEPETTEKINKTEILQWTEKAFGVPIKGKVTHKWKSAGMYYPKEQIVRMRTWGELAVMTHEIAHHLDYQMNDVLGKNWRRKLGAKGGKKVLIKELADLDYNQNPKSGRRTREGFAEFMRYYLTTDLAQKKAPKFYDVFTNKFMKERPDTAKIINELKDKMSIWQGQGAENRILAQIDFKGEHTKIRGIQNKYERAKAWVLKNFNDEFYYPQKVVREIEKISGKKLRPSENPATLMEFGKSKAGFIARTFVMDKAVDESGNIVGKGLVDILKPLEHDKVKSFITYAVAKRALLKEGQGKESGIDVDDAKFIIDKYKNDTWDKAIDEITEWSNHLLDWVVRAGGLGPNEAAIIREMNPIYLPFKRAFVDELTVMKGGVGGITDRGQAIKRMKGSGRPILNPIESLIGTATEMISKAQKIRIASAWAKLAEEKGVGGFITEVPAPIGSKTVPVGKIKDFKKLLFDLGVITENEYLHDINIDMDKLATVFFQDWQYKGKDNIVSLWVDGKRKFYELHPELYRALNGMDTVQINNIGWMLMEKFTRMLRLGATGAKVSFGLVRNPFRDAFTYAVFSENKGARLWDPAKGLYKEITAKPGDLLWRFKKTGGSLSGMIGYDRAATMSTYDDMLLELLGKKGKVLKIVKHPVNTLRDILSLTELAPRSVEMEKSYERYIKENPDWSEEDAYIAAFNDAQDVTINFTKSGYYSKRINQVVAFFNVAIRGPEKLYRSLKKNPVRTIVRGLGWLTMLAMMNHWRNRDKDWYKNLPPAYKYSNFFIEIGDTVIRLPIPFDLGILFSSLPMVAMDTMVERDPQYLKGLMEQLKMSLPELTPDIIGPLIDVATNKNWIGTPIESEGMKYEYPTKRVKHFTSLLAKKLSIGFDAVGVKLSPIQIDYLLDSYTGGFRKQLPGRQIFEPADIPILGDFLLRMPDNPRRQLNIFYSEYELLSQKVKSGIATAEESTKLDNMKPLYGTLSKKFKRLKTEMTAEDVNMDKIRGIYIEMREVLENPPTGRPRKLRKLQKLKRLQR